MNLVLLAITLISVAAAAGLGWYAWRLRELEGQRSDARVAALSSAIYDDSRLRGPVEAAPPSVGTLFALEHSAAAKGSPGIRLTVGAAMGVALLVAIAVSGGDSGPAGAPAQAATSVRSAPRTASLELLSMRHERIGDTLRVSGLVRNPRAGGQMTRVIAVVFAFDRSGTFVASGNAGLDFTTLEAGDESPFVVTIAGVSEVGRYRVSFRTQAGVIRHVDRRAEQLGLAARLEQD